MGKQQTMKGNNQATKGKDLSRKGQGVRGIMKNDHRTMEMTIYKRLALCL